MFVPDIHQLLFDYYLESYLPPLRQFPPPQIRFSTCGSEGHVVSRLVQGCEEEEVEEEDLFVFNDTIEGPRAPAVKPGRITQA